MASFLIVRRILWSATATTIEYKSLEPTAAWLQRSARLTESLVVAWHGMAPCTFAVPKVAFKHSRSFECVT